jgi:N-methylhydantoinase B/oxoprolinase/acetone carboxylase alpha subunit
MLSFYTTADGGKTDDQLHSPLLDSPRVSKTAQDDTRARIAALGLTDDEVTEALKE